MELCHSKASTDKTRTESPALHWQWQWQNISAQTRPQVQAPLGILPYVADLTAHSTLLIQRTTHFSKAFSTLFWDSFKFDETHQDTPTQWLTLQIAELPFHAKHLKNLHWSCESLKFHLCTAQPCSGRSSSDRTLEPSVMLLSYWEGLCKELQSLAQITPGFCTHKQRRVVSNPIQALVGFWKHIGWI